MALALATAPHDVLAETIRFPVEENNVRVVFHLNSTLQLGGTERQLVTLLRALDPGRWRNRLVCFRASGGYLDETRRLGIEPTELRLPSSLAHPATALTIVRLARLLRRERAAVLHCHDVYANLIGVPAARLAGVPVIASRRDLGHHLTRAHRLGLRYALGAASRVLANARRVADHVIAEEHVGAERVVVIENGIDLAAFDRAAARQPDPIPGIPEGAPFVLTVGHLVDVAKGHADLLRAIALVGDRAPGLRFAIAGGGPLLSDLQGLARDLGVTDRVCFMWTRADVAALLERATFVVHPARQEGMPNAVLEAMAAGRPIIATRAGGTAELLGDGREGVLVPTHDPRALAEAIVSLAADPDRRAHLGAAARLRVEREFSVERLGERAGRLYEELIAGATGADGNASGPRARRPR